MSDQVFSQKIGATITAICLTAFSCNLIKVLNSRDSVQVTESQDFISTEVIKERINQDEIGTETVPQTGELEQHALLTDLSENLVNPDEFEYLGAFRLPPSSDELGWGYSGYAMTYYPQGDPQGENDGFPGSLYVLGHDHTQTIAEISIPTPVISQLKNPVDLPFASMLQPFYDIRGDMYPYLEIPRAGLAYLPPHGDQTSGKLYFCWGQHFQFEPEASHGWSELDLSEPESKGPWHIGSYTNYVTNDYMFEIPQAWSDSFTPGLKLATGRFRDGGWGGLGPTLLAIGPYNEGNPPGPGSALRQVTPLLMYGVPIPGDPSLDISAGHQIAGYSHADEWSGGAWVTSGDRSAMILVGTKAMGNTWYGFSNGVVYPISGDPNEEYPEVPPWPHDDRGWWSDGISAQIIFFDPLELGAVALGEMDTWEPQPYATLTLDDFLFDPGFDFEGGKRYLLGASAFDRQNKLVYIVERLADEDDRSLIHVFRVN
ncbi:hypothetical protein ACFLUC_01680 [Chloroflexota bacterium]